MRATVESNRAYSVLLGELWSTFCSLNGTEKMRSILYRSDGLIFKCQHVADGTFCQIGSNSDMTTFIQMANLAEKKFYYFQFNTNGTFTSGNSSSATSGFTISLYA